MRASLTDRAALARHRRRAARAPALFLHEAAERDLKDRLQMVNRTFTEMAVITGMPGFWQAAFPDACVVADDDTLDLVPGSVDLVVHAMCLHWANDPVGQLVQARRALRPDGLFLGVLAGGTTLHELRSALAQAEAELTGGLSPRVVPMAEIRDLGALLQRAGFALPVADSVDLVGCYRDLPHLARDLRAMGETNAMTARPRAPTRPALFRRAAALYAETYANDHGQLPATFDLIFLTGWAPDDSQPRPLRPGSAQSRLADVLGTRETPLKD